MKSTSTILTLLTATILTAAGCDTVGPLVLQSSEQSERAYEQLTIEWTRWALSLPASTGPIADATGEACTMGQGDGFWFLAGSSGGAVERECTIPADTPLFFPLMNLWIVPSPSQVDEPEEQESIIGAVANYFAWDRSTVCDLTLRIDGEDLLADTAERDAELYVAITEPFTIELNDDNWASGWGKPGGTYDWVFTHGHFALFKPLAPGDHVLEFGGANCDEDGDISFSTSATYHLHVEGEPEQD
jgi:hypothetical protein